jgi:hypothetical protein
MLEISLPLFVLVTAWGVVMWLTKRKRRLAGLDTVLYPWQIALLGLSLIVVAYFFQPWVKLDFILYLDPTSGFLAGLLPPDAMASLVNRIGLGWAAQLFHLLATITVFNGWQLQLIPTLSIPTRLWTVIPMLVAGMGVLITIVGTVWRNSIVSCILWTVLIVASVLSAIGLLASLQNISSLDVSGQFGWTLLVSILGVQIGNGPWYTLVGLLCMALSGLRAIIVPTRDNTMNMEYTEWQPSSLA